MLREIYSGVYGYKGKIYTLSNLCSPVYGEHVLKMEGRCYREWIPSRSKLGAALHRGIKHFEFSGKTVLYLGAASGTTVSHVADISRHVFAVEFSPITGRKLLALASKYDNISPIIADASFPDVYKDLLIEVDVVFQDIAQRNQVGIFNKNMVFLKKGGYGYLSVKTRSISVVENPKKILKDVRRELSLDYDIVEEIDLSPYEKDHALFVVRKH